MIPGAKSHRTLHPELFSVSWKVHSPHKTILLPHDGSLVALPASSEASPKCLHRTGGGEKIPTEMGPLFPTASIPESKHTEEIELGSLVTLELLRLKYVNVCCVWEGPLTGEKIEGTLNHQRLFCSTPSSCFSFPWTQLCLPRPTDQFPRPSGSPLRPPFKGGDLPFFYIAKTLPKGSGATGETKSLSFCCCFFLARHGAWGILVPPNQGSNPCPLQWKRSLNHWATREVPQEFFLNLSCYMFSIHSVSLKNVLRSFIRHCAVCLATLL